MKFTIKQLFSVVDGRLSTGIEDVYAVLDTATGESLMTHHLLIASRYIAMKKPLWYVLAKIRIDEIKRITGEDFWKIMDYIDKNCPNTTIDVQELTPEQKEDFPEFMFENSLLLKYFTS